MSCSCRHNQSLKFLIRKISSCYCHYHAHGVGINLPSGFLNFIRRSSISAVRKGSQGYSAIGLSGEQHRSSEEKFVYCILMILWNNMFLLWNEQTKIKIFLYTCISLVFNIPCSKQTTPYLAPTCMSHKTSGISYSRELWEALFFLHFPGLAKIYRAYQKYWMLVC